MNYAINFCKQVFMWICFQFSQIYIWDWNFWVIYLLNFLRNCLFFHRNTFALLKFHSFTEIILLISQPSNVTFSKRPIVNLAFCLPLPKRVWSGVEQRWPRAAELGAKGKQTGSRGEVGSETNKPKRKKKKTQPDKTTDIEGLAREAQTKFQAKGLCRAQEWETGQ